MITTRIDLCFAVSLFFFTGFFLTGYAMANDNTGAFYDFEVQSIEGATVPLNSYKGDVLLLVNTASRCGYTPQYGGLQKLYEQFSDKGFSVLAFPSNDFGGQEPGTEVEIKNFCDSNYAISFPMFSKTVVSGGEKAPLFAHLTNEANPDFTGEIQWNFEKFLIGRDGSLLGRFRSGVAPESPELVTRIESALSTPRS